MLLAAVCADAAPLGDELDAKRRQWQAAGIQSYTYRYQRPCACQKEDRSLFAVTVVDGTVAEVIYIQPETGARTPIAKARQHWYPTIDNLFDQLRDAKAMNAARVEAAYDPRYGYPVRIFVDYDAALTDDDMDVRVSDFQIAE